MNTNLEGRGRRENVGEAERGRLRSGFDQNILQACMKFSNNKNSFFSGSHIPETGKEMWALCG